MRFFDIKEERHVVVDSNDLPLLARVTIWSTLVSLIVWLILGNVDMSVTTKLVVLSFGVILANLVILERLVRIDLANEEVSLTTRRFFGREIVTTFPLRDIQIIKSREVTYGSLLNSKITYVLRLRYPLRGLDITLAESSSESNLSLDTYKLTNVLIDKYGEDFVINDGVIEHIS